MGPVKETWLALHLQRYLFSEGFSDDLITQAGRNSTVNRKAMFNIIPSRRLSPEVTIIGEGSSLSPCGIMSHHIADNKLRDYQTRLQL